jgi:signal transduction histidine kinase
METTNNSKAYQSAMGKHPLPTPGTIPTEPIGNIPRSLSKPGLWWSEPPAVLRYGMAVLSVTVALIIARLLHTHHLVSPPVQLQQVLMNLIMNSIDAMLSSRLAALKHDTTSYVVH